jgi:uncharacterized membrane protein YgcG
VIRAFLSPLLLLASAACDAQAPAGGTQARPVAALEAPAAKPLPALTGRVVDNAGILTAQAEAALDARLAALEKETTDQLVVVTVARLDGEPIGDLGLRLGNGWHIGQKESDNGVLLIVAPTDRQARIEVGLGLEGLLTDERAERILKEQVIPECREGRCDRAVADGVAAIAKVLRSDPRRPRRRPGAE